jgi:hypothetical protein
MATKETKKTEKKREDKPLAETKVYDMDASTLAEKLKKVQADSDARRVASYEERKAREAARKQSTSSSKGPSFQGLNTSLGGKVITK